VIELAPSAPQDPLERVLATVVRRLRDVTGGAFVAVYAYRPHSDDFEAIHGDAIGTVSQPDGVLLSDIDGAPLGLISLGAPIDDPARLLCAYAEQALRADRHAKAAQEQRQLLARLAELAPRLAACGSPEELETLVVSAITRHFGFERAAIYAAGATTLTLSTAAGWAPEDGLAPTLDADAIRAVLALQGELVIGLFGSDHCLVLPWPDEGLVVVDAARDRVTPERRHALRVLLALAS
jgi:GAF domain-containing protein